MRNKSYVNIPDFIIVITEKYEYISRLCLNPFKHDIFIRLPLQKRGINYTVLGTLIRVSVVVVYYVNTCCNKT